MKLALMSVSALALFAAVPASAQILGGSIGGTVGGAVGGTIGGVNSTIDTTVRTTVDTPRRVRGNRERRADARTVADGNLRLGERRVYANGDIGAMARLTRDQRMLRTRGAVAATQRGMRRQRPTASGVQVFVPGGSIAPPPAVVVVPVRPYPAYSTTYYYGGPDAVYVEDRDVDVYVDHQYREIARDFEGTGADVRRSGDALVIRLPADVTFAFDKSDIQGRFYGPLERFAETIRAYPASDIEVIGHTDSVGSDAYNLGLSERRGRSVADFLVAQGIDPARLVVEGMGETEPVASNATVEGRAANRRVELILHTRGG